MFRLHFDHSAPPILLLALITSNGDISVIHMDILLNKMHPLAKSIR